MTHLTEEDMVLRYYGEAADLRRADLHLADCAECRRQFDELSKTLQAMSAVEVPERGETYGAEVWARIQPRLDALETLSWPLRLSAFFSWPRLIAGGALATLLVAAFVAGRYWPSPAMPAAPVRAEATPAGARERILLVAVGEHLDRSRMVLAELSNIDGSGPVDISAEQDRARDLVASNRLYRQAAVRDGKNSVADVLDELERVLVDIANGPATASPADLERLRERLEAQGLVFKVKVLESQITKDASRPVVPASSKS